MDSSLMSALEEKIALTQAATTTRADILKAAATTVSDALAAAGISPKLCQTAAVANNSQDVAAVVAARKADSITAVDNTAVQDDAAVVGNNNEKENTSDDDTAVTELSANALNTLATALRREVIRRGDAEAAAASWRSKARAQASAAAKASKQSEKMKTLLSSNMTQVAVQKKLIDRIEKTSALTKQHYEAESKASSARLDELRGQFSKSLEGIQEKIAAGDEGREGVLKENELLRERLTKLDECDAARAQQLEHTVKMHDVEAQLADAKLTQVRRCPFPVPAILI
jgi:hypothetical protein